MPTATTPAKEKKTSSRVKAEQTMEVANKTTIDASKIKVGDVVTITHFAKVRDIIKGGREINVVNLDLRDCDFWIRGTELVEQCMSADQFAKEIEVTRTQCVEKLMVSYNVPFTVCFDKADGSERVLRGRLIQPEAVFGRSHVEDLEVDRSQNRTRLVDHRTVKWLVVGNVKYTVTK